MAIDVQGLVEDAKKKRAAAKAAADKAKAEAAKSKAQTRQANEITLQANNKFDYANNLEGTITDLEGQLQTYITKIARDGELSAIDKKEFNRLQQQYNKVTSAYQKAYNEGNKILSTMPTEAKGTIKVSKKESPVDLTGQAITGEQTKVAGQPDDFAGLIKAAYKDVKDMTPSERLSLALDLRSIGINVPKSGEFTDTLAQGYTQLLNSAKAYYTQHKEFPTVDSYLAEMQRQAKILNIGLNGTGTGGTTTKRSISAATEAAGLIQPLFKTLLGRDATAAEVKDITKQLNAAEKNNPVKTTTDAKGNTVYTGGIDRNQFLTDAIKTLPEFKKKEAQGLTLTENDIADTARLNGLSLSSTQLSDYAKRVKNGEDIKVIQNEIRAAASLGQPDSIKQLMANGTNLDTIYSPYKALMATSLGINPSTITLNDPTLRMAIGPDKEMSLYDFRKAIRQDNRWKYSQEANDEVTNMINQVKRDFGFMG